MCTPGANLYWIFIAKMSDPEEYRAYHAGILDAIQRAGASMSHHHGIGKMFGPWLEGQRGAPGIRRDPGAETALTRITS